MYRFKVMRHSLVLRVTACQKEPYVYTRDMFMYVYIGHTYTGIDTWVNMHK